MATPASDQVHAKATKALNALEDLITEVSAQAPDPQMAKEAVAPLKDCSTILRKVVDASGKTEKPPAEPKPTIESATDEMMAEKNAPSEGDEQLV
ncbi:hypothetical protein [Sinimarinibacterium flocculans]|uniref:hypothetical protein n=1 Tax=Sinimarinibacterium flocculans TaxID=985250 RepID=UPI00248F8054|nr:hypothetical protein [Sinimarinibacterium flocculans]